MTPGEEDRLPPSDAIVLFDGTDLSAWQNGSSWRVADGVATVKGGMIRSKEHFGDCQVHIEWSAPLPVKGTSQQRGNSGVFFLPEGQDEGYEVQILDCYNNKTYFDGQASAVYKQTPPMANVCRPPGEWNMYDVMWTGPRFNEDGTLKSPAYVTVMHNGVLTVNHFELLGKTPFNKAPAYKTHSEKVSIGLQDHGNPVRFRNIWVRKLNPAVGKQVRPPYFRDNGKTWPADQESSISE